MSSAPNAVTCNPLGGGVSRERAVLVNSDFQSAPIDDSLDAFCRAVLKVIAEFSPCSEDRLFIVAATRELGGEQSLGNLKKRLRAGLLQLIDKGAVEIQGEELVVTARGKSALEADAQAELAVEPIYDAEQTEIVTSIRRVITDDESSNSKAQSASSRREAKDESLEDREDSQITEDVARVLSDRGAKAPENDVEEEILDLAAELGGVEVVEDEADPVAEVTEGAAKSVLPKTEEIEETAKPKESASRPPQAYQSQSKTHPQTNVPERTKATERSAAFKRAVAALRAERLRTSTAPPAETYPEPDADVALQVSAMSADLPRVEVVPDEASEKIGEPDDTELVLTDGDMSVAAETIVEPETRELDGDASPDSSYEPPSDLFAKLAPKVSTSETERAEHNEPHPKFTWAGPKVEEQSGSLLGYLAENIPRRMRAHKTVEAEVRVAPTISQELVSNLVGQGSIETHEVQIAQAMSLRLSAPKGGFEIEPQSPETQWVWRNKQTQPENDLAAWRFALTPTRRGSHTLRLTFSYKEVGPDGLIADSALPDKVLDIVVRTNIGKFCAQAALWSLTLISGAALGVYFQSIEPEFAPIQRVFSQALELFHDLGS